MHRHSLRRNGGRIAYPQLTQQQIIDLINELINNDRPELVRDELREILVQLAGLAGSGGAGTVSTDATIDGDGAVATPLSLADNAVSTPKIVNQAVTAPKIDDMGATVDIEVLSWDANAGEWTPKTLTVSGGTIVGDDNSLDFSFTGTGGNYFYSPLAGVYVLASGVGITCSKVVGSATFTVPNDVFLHKFWFTGSASDWNSGEFTITIVGGNGSGTSYNTQDSDTIYPFIYTQNRNVITTTQPFKQDTYEVGGNIEILNVRNDPYVSGQTAVKLTGLSSDRRIIGMYL